jgi:hypothetical protein
VRNICEDFRLRKKHVVAQLLESTKNQIQQQKASCAKRDSPSADSEFAEFTRVFFSRTSKIPSKYHDGEEKEVETSCTRSSTQFETSHIESTTPDTRQAQLKRTLLQDLNTLLYQRQYDSNLMPHHS